jgi:RNA polymerase sigma factor (sigma-70 family)
MVLVQDDLLALARAAGSGHTEAVGTLITAIGGAMLRAVRKVLGSEHPDVDDVTQDAVIALLEALPRFREECTISHFAHRVAFLTALAARRRAHTRNRHTEPDCTIDDLAGDQVSPLSSLIANRRRETVRQLVDELNEPVAEALGLHFILGYTVEEIATLSAVPPDTVWSRLRLGKQALRRRLRHHPLPADLSSAQ